MMKIGGIDVKDLRVGAGGSAVTPSRVMVGTGSEAVKIWPLIEVHEVSLTDVTGMNTVHPLLTVTVPAGETWSVRIQGTVTKTNGNSYFQPSFRIGAATSGKYKQGAAVDFSGTVTAANSTIALVVNDYNGTSFTGTVTIEK